MSVIRVGSTSTYAEGWDAIFGGRRSPKPAAAKAARAKPAATTATRKKASRVAKKKAVTKARKPGKRRRG